MSERETERKRAKGVSIKRLRARARAAELCLNEARVFFLRPPAIFRFSLLRAAVTGFPKIKVTRSSAGEIYIGLRSSSRFFFSRVLEKLTRE